MGKWNGKKNENKKYGKEGMKRGKNAKKCNGKRNENGKKEMGK